MMAPDAAGTLSTTTFRAIAEARSEHGLPALPIFAACDLTEAARHDDLARLPVALEHRMGAEIERRSGHPVIGLILAQAATQLLVELSCLAPLVTAVQQVLGEGLARRQVSLTAIARALGTSERTLRRRLALLGISFQSLLEGVRRGLAACHLREGDDSATRIAERLGCSTTGAFQRAFQRCHGVGPSHFRAVARTRRTGAFCRAGPLERDTLARRRREPCATAGTSPPPSRP